MSGETFSWLGELPQLTRVLAGAVLAALAISLALSRRGGRFRHLPGWAGFWVSFAPVLVLLELAPRWISFPLLAIVMYVSLREYFFIAPVRPRDRYVILASYVAIPFALLPAYRGSVDTFLAAIPTSLVLLIPAFLALGRREAGMLDSAGRTIFGVVFFVFCTAHLALLVDAPSGTLELFGVLVLISEFPQRLFGLFRSSQTVWVPLVGLLLSLVLALGVGYLLGPWASLSDDDGLRAGLFVFIGVSLGSRVALAVAQDLDLDPRSLRGRGRVLDRVAPAVYAAPLYFHYLNHFA